MLSPANQMLACVGGGPTLSEAAAAAWVDFCPLGVVVRWGNVLTHPYLGAASGRAAYRAAMLAL